VVSTLMDCVMVKASTMATSRQLESTTRLENEGAPTVRGRRGRWSKRSPIVWPMPLHHSCWRGSCPRCTRLPPRANDVPPPADG
jgi:hypothetical protein